MKPSKILAPATAAFLTLVAAMQHSRCNAADPAPKKGSMVQVVPAAGGFQLVRDGKPYRIQGAGGDGSRKLLAEVGGNSLRTWGVEHLAETLDEAHRHGLSVTVGIWLGHERHGFNYNDADQLARQIEEVRQTVKKFSQHPAVLIWALGNEMEGYEKGDNGAIWSAVNNLASLVKQLDPNHPTMTVIAEIGGDRVKNIHRLCPDIDIVGINSYGGGATIAERYQKAGGVKPYILTEFGPPGTWETAKNGWGVAPELTSTAKGEIYGRVYRQAVLGQPGKCLGAYAFTWGNKQEATATWFGMLLPDGSRLEAVDALGEVWSGKPPANRCPQLTGLKWEGDDQVEPGAIVKATLKAADPEKDRLTVQWVLARETEAAGIGGDAEAETESFSTAIVRGDLLGVEIKLPLNPGGYRLFAYVRDGHGGAAVANLPILVKGQVIPAKGRAAKLPLVIYDEGDRDKPPYIPSGWMGNLKSLKLDEKCEGHPHTGKTCIRVEYLAQDGWAGVVWQSPAGDWGDKPGGFNLTGAKQISFWARGEKGGEEVGFEIGIYGAEKKYPDTAHGKLEKVKLTTEWKRFQINLEKLDLSRIKSGFVFSTASSGAPIRFYLDDIVVE